MDWHSVKPEHAELVARLEQDVRDNPKSYNRRLYWLAMLGYGFLWGVLLLIVGIIAGAVALVIVTQSGGLTVFLKKALIPLFILAGLIIRAMWVRVKPPEGIELKREDAPGLFAFLDEMRKRKKGPKIYKVMIESRMNAAIVQHPRFGIFGGYRNYLLLGLPLLMALDKEQAEAVIAHEYGHLVAGDGRFGVWIYRVRSTWSKVAEALFVERKWGDFIFEKFFGWYVPFFNAYSFVQARAHEYAADRFAAETVNANAVGGSLIALGIHDNDVENIYWSKLWHEADSQNTPSHMPFAGMPPFFRRPDVDKARWQMILDQMMTYETGLNNTHPALPDRLKAVGAEPKLPDPPEENAAQALLGETFQRLLEEMDREWWDEAAPHWHKRFENAENGRSTLAALKQMHEKEPASMSADDLWELASLTDWLEGSDKAVPHYRELIEKHPDFTRGYAALGSVLIDMNDAEGVALMDKARQMDDAYTMAVCRKVYPFLKHHGKEDEAEEFRQLAIRRSEKEQAAHEERDILRKSDTLLPHGLPDEVLYDLGRQMHSLPSVLKKVEAAFIARKKVEHFPEEWPFYVLGFKLKSHYHWMGMDGDMLETVTEGVKLPGDGYYVMLTPDNKQILEKFQALPGAKFIDAGKICVPTPQAQQPQQAQQKAA